MEIEALESKKANHLSITLIHEHKPVSILIGKCLITSIVRLIGLLCDIDTMSDNKQFSC